MFLARTNRVYRLFRSADEILRRKGIGQGKIVAPTRVAVHVLVWGVAYGAVMGSYGWVVGARSFTEQLPQIVYSAVKIPLLLAITLVVAMPSFFVFNSLLGLRRDFGFAVKAIVSAQSGLTIILFSLAPLTAFWYVSCGNNPSSYSSAILFNAFLFGVSSLSAQILLRGYYQPLISKNSRHRLMLWTWILIYAFVGIQAAWITRPFIGSPDSEITFFRADTWGNAYLKIWEMMSKLAS